MHETEINEPVRANGVARHAPGVVGSVDTSAVPAPSTATHNRTVGHETAFSRCGLSTVIGSDHVNGSAGVVDINTRPAASIATHNDVEGQETPLSGVIRSMFDEVHAGAPRKVDPDSRLPAASTTKHRAADGHEIASRRPSCSIRASMRQPSRRSGVLVERTPPPLSIATHRDADGQSSAVSSREGVFDGAAGSQFNGAAARAA